MQYKVLWQNSVCWGPSFRRRPWPFGERGLRARATSATLQPNSSHVNGFLLFMQFPKFLLHIQNSRLQLWLKKSVWIFHMFRIIVQPWSHFPKGAIFEGCARVCSSLEKTLEPESSGEMSESEYIALKSKSSSMKVKVKVNTDQWKVKVKYEQNWEVKLASLNQWKWLFCEERKQ